MPMHHFPGQVTAFVGRAEDLEQISSRLANPACRLLTLVGPGGIGKTRLAIAAASAQSGVFADGIYFVALQAINSTGAMITAIAEALDVEPEIGDELNAQLLNFLRRKALLLVLDNVEHLLEDVTFITDLLNAAPQTKILATSREAMKLREEWVFEVNGLGYPENYSGLPIENYDAARLFLGHALQGSSSFQLQNTDRLGLAQLCRIVDGMPLALELAGTWVRSLSCLEIAQEIERSLDILTSPKRDTPARHRSMRVVMDHSWNRLSETEQNVFMKLSVFRGGFTRAAMEAVSEGSLQTLAALMDKSLVRRTSDGHYGLHELLRHYANEQLARNGGSERTRDAHSAYYLEFLRQRQLDIQGNRQVTALNEIEVDFENIRAAWYRALERKNYLALDLAVESLFHYCEMRGRIQDGKELLGAAQLQLEHETDSAFKPVWGRILVRRLWTLSISNRGLKLDDSVKDQIEEALAIAHQQGDKSQIAFCLWVSGALGRWYSNSEVDIPLFIPVLEESLALFTELGDRFYMARAADWLAALYSGSGNQEKLVTLSEQSLLWRRAIGDQFGTASSLWNLMSRATETGAFERAKRLNLEMGEIYEAIGGGRWVIRQIAYLALIAFYQGDFDESRERAEEAQRLASKTGLASVGPAVTGLAIALSLLGLLDALEGDYRQGWSLREGTVSQGIDLIGECLAVAACGLGEYSTAQISIAKDLKQSLFLGNQRRMAASLPVAAVLMASEDRKAQATELLGLAFNHHASARAWVERWPLLTRLRAHLELELGSEVYEKAWERGKSSNLEAVTETLIQYFHPDEPHQTVQSSNWTLVEPLTERELEILRQISCGLSNAEIAEQLVIEVSTVKKHINRLYDKIGAKSRTHALVRAKELYLI